MGMFDYYIPEPLIKCPVCGIILSEWQGKDGPCGFFVWKQGEAVPIDQKAGDNNISEPQRAKLRLPSIFIIYSYQCGCPYPVEAMCYCEGGTWTTSVVINADSARRKPEEGKEDWNKRRSWLKSGHK